MATIRAVLFDATGTLIELRAPVGETYRRFALDHGVDLSARRLDDAFSRVVARAGARVFPGTGPVELARRRERDWWRKVVRDTFRAADQAIAWSDFPRFFDALFDYYGGSEAWRLRPGAEPMLRELARVGLHRAIVSNFDYRLTAILDSLGINQLFDSVCLPYQFGFEKPDPRLFQAALDALDVTAREAVFVGDHPERDLAGARESGLAAIDVRDLANLTELPDRLATLGGRKSQGPPRDTEHEVSSRPADDPVEPS